MEMGPTYEEFLAEIERLKKRGQEYQETINNSDTAVVRTSFEGGRILSFNPAFLNILEYKAEELLGRPAVEFYVEPDARMDNLEELKEKGEFHDFEFNIKTKSGTVRAIYNDEGSAIKGL